MYEKLLNTKLKVAIFIVLTAFVVLSIININRADKRAKDRPADILPENANAADLSSFLDTEAHAHADAINRDFQNTRKDPDNKPVGRSLYIYKNRKSVEKQLFIQEATQEQMRTADEMPPEIRKLQDQMNDMNRKAAKSPQVINAVKIKNIDPEDVN